MSDIFNTDITFAELGLKQPLLQAIEKAGFVHPTHVQAKLIPLAIKGADVLGQSKTGTGKTAAFGLPLLNQFGPDDHFAGLVLVPTRELAVQVAHELRELGRFANVHTVPIYGGQKMSVQINKLSKKPHIIVGTPGRVMDLHSRGHLPYNKVKIAVLDEVDRMLDIGFRDDIRRILGTMQHKHQTIFVSATISTEIEQLARRYMTNPEKLELTKASSLTVSQVKQFHFAVEPWDKSRLLVHLLRTEEPALTLVFCRTKITVDALAELLQRKKIDATAIHGDMYQGKRNSVMQRFRDGKLGVLVASDLAARGLDVDGITHVVNYDLPEDPEVYVHRIGRTARAGQEGIAWAFVTPQQGALLTSIEKLINIEIPAAEYADFEPGPVPPDVRARLEREAERIASRPEYSRVTKAPPSEKDAQDATRYPGGVVPKKTPARRMGGRVKTRRR